MSYTLSYMRLSLVTMNDDDDEKKKMRAAMMMMILGLKV